MVNKKTLGSFTKLAITLGVFGVLGSGCVSCVSLLNESQNRCSKKFSKGNEQIIGTVIGEKYIDGRFIKKSPEFDGYMSFANETVRLGDSKYSIKIRTDEGNSLAINVIDRENGEKEALESLIEVNSRVSFPRGNYSGGRYGCQISTDDSETYFHEGTQTGTKRADRITVLR